MTTLVQPKRDARLAHLIHPKALVADDHHMFTEFHKDALEALGFDVEVSWCGSWVWDLVRKKDHGFRVLVLDNAMPPGPSGCGIVQRMRVKGDKTPVLLCSMSSRDELLSLELGGEWPEETWHLDKGVERLREAVSEKVSSILGGSV